MRDGLADSTNLALENSGEIDTLAVTNRANLDRLPRPELKVSDTLVFEFSNVREKSPVTIDLDPYGRSKAELTTGSNLTVGLRLWAPGLNPSISLEYFTLWTRRLVFSLGLPAPMIKLSIAVRSRNHRVIGMVLMPSESKMSVAVIIRKSEHMGDKYLVGQSPVPLIDH